MPVARPQFNKTLQRIKLQSKLDHTMSVADEKTDCSARTLKLVAKLFDRKIQCLKNDPLEQFLKKQPQLKRELINLVSIVEQFAEDLDNLKEQSPILKDFSELVDVDELEKNAYEFIDKMDKMALDDLDGPKGNGIEANGNGHSNGKTNGTNGSCSVPMIIDPFKWEPCTPEIPMNEPINGVVSHVYTPSSFYVQPFPGIIEFTMKVQYEQEKLIKKGMVSLPEIKEGMYCAARFYEDYYWYRARIVSVIRSTANPDEIASVYVFYLDYGNAAQINLEQIMPLARSVSFQKLMAVACHFIHVDPKAQWPNAAAKAMKDKLGDGKVEIFFSKPTKITTDNGRKFLSFPVELYTSDDHKVFDSVRKFY